MNANTKPLLFAALVAVLALGGILIYFSQSAASPADDAKPAVSAPPSAAAVEQPEADAEPSVRLATDFTVYTDEGESVRLSDYFGKPIVLNFGATWCPPCQMEMPHLEDAYARYGEDVQFMLVDVTDGEQDSSETVAAFIEENGYTFPVFLDPLLDATRAYSVYSLPLTVFIDEQGVISSTYVGGMTEAILEQRIREILPSA